MVRCAVSGFGPSSIDFQLVYDDRARDFDARALNKSAICIAILRTFKEQGIRIRLSDPDDLHRRARRDAGHALWRAACPADRRQEAQILMPIASLDDIRCRIGEEIGVSTWMLVDQARIDAFAEATDDHQFIHIDPAAAAATPFGGTIAHGFLTLSLLSRMGAEAMLLPDTMKMAINYGLENVRFLAPGTLGQARARAFHA